MHSISWLSWWIWHGSGKFILSLNLNEDPMKGNDVDDQPTLIVKLPQTHEFAHLLSNQSILRSFQLQR